MLPLLATLPPDGAILILTLGIALIAVELNRPGWILPGAAGLLLTLLAAASLSQHALAPLWAVGSLLFVSILLVQARRTLHLSLAVASMVLLILCLKRLIVPPGPPISTWVALICGTLLGAGTTVLTRVARRARQNKGLD